MRTFLLGLLLGLLVLPVTVWSWLHYGHPPVAVADKPFPLEHAFLNGTHPRRIASEMPRQPVMGASPVNMLLGAQIYRANCAVCHGLYGRPSEIGSHIYPKAPQLWAPHGNGIVGVSDDPPGATFWRVKNGIRLSAMPAFGHVLNEAQIWQVSLLLANADKPLPTGVMTLLQQPLPSDTPAQAPTSNGPTSPVNIPVEPLPQN